MATASEWTAYVEATTDPVGDNLYVRIGSGGGSQVVATLVDSFSAPSDLDTRIYAVNCGGPAIDGWVADTPYVLASGTNTYAHDDTLSIDLSQVADPAPEKVYRSERLAPLTVDEVTYAFPIESDHHLIRIHLAENWPPSMIVGGRVHTVRATVGSTSDSDSSVDVFARVGAGNRAYILELEVEAAAPTLIVGVAHVSGDRPRIQGIEIFAADPLTNVPPPFGSLLMSTTSDRSNPVDLQGRTITSEPYYIFAETDATPPIDFYLDGNLERSDSAAPYDYAGDTGGQANPADIADGSHNMELRSGSTVLDNAAFTVAISVDEEYPANPAVVLSPGASQTQINSALGTSGRIVEFQPGFYGDRQVAPAQNVHMFCRTPYGAHFQAPATGQKRWNTGGGSGVRIDGFKIDRYCPGPATARTEGAIVVPASGWTLDRIEIMAAEHAGVRLNNNTTLRRFRIHDCGRYAWAGGHNCLIIDGQAWRLCVKDGTQLVPLADTSDRGLCKMAASSTGNHVQSVEAWNIQAGKGLWWDGARDGTADDVYIHDIEHNAFAIEVCWGGAENAPSGHTVTWPDPAFVLTNLRAEDQWGSRSDDWPTPAAFMVANSPGVWYDGLYARNVGQSAISVQAQASSHSLWSRGFTAANPPISPEWCVDELRNHNVWFRNFTLEGSTKKFGVATHGGWDGAMGTMYSPRFASGGTPSARYATTPERYRHLSNTNMTRSQWLSAANAS